MPPAVAYGVQRTAAAYLVAHVVRASRTTAGALVVIAHITDHIARPAAAQVGP